MGNFSRDPGERVADARRNHYTAVRLQQGVPLLDADWNEAEALRREELEEIGRWILGDGVPPGNDGFRVVALPAGGVGLVVLQARTAAGSPSSLSVDVAASTAASALGFTAANAFASRLGAPARLTGRAVEPFPLVDGAKLVLKVDGAPAETVTFAKAAFASIGAAKAAEVAAAISAGAPHVLAAAGAGNDFLVRGGDGTVEGAGRMAVAGRVALIESDVVFSEQPLWSNPALAAAWSVAPVDPLTTSTDPQTVYLDVWNREVGPDEDDALVDDRIGIATAVRLRREWAVRIARSADWVAVRAARPPGHAYGALAELQRGGNQPAVLDASAVDLRDVDHAIRRTVAYRAANGTVVVDGAALATVLAATRDAVRDLIAFVATRFLPPGTPYTAGEVVSLDAASAVAAVADQALALLAARALDTRGALALLAQLLAVEERFVDVWTTGMLAVARTPSYDGQFKQMLQRIRNLLDGPAPGGLAPLRAALGAGNLQQAVLTQDRVNLELTSQNVARPTGTLLLTCLGSTTGTIARNASFDVRWRASGSVTPADDVDVEFTIDSKWLVTRKNASGGAFALSLGPGADSEEFITTIQPPDLAAAATDLGLTIYARHNRSQLRYDATTKHLAIGAAPPVSEADYLVDVPVASVSLSAGQYQVPRTLASADLTFRFHNDTNVPETVDVAWQPTSSTDWTIVDGGFAVKNAPVAAKNVKDMDFQFAPPNAAGKALAFTITVSRSNGGPKLAELTVSLVTT